MVVSGVGAVQSALQVTADNLAHATMPGFEPSRVIFQAEPTGGVRAHVEHPQRRNESEGEEQEETPSGTDLAEEMVDLAVIRNTYTANMAVVRSQADTLGILVDIRA